VSRRGSNVVEFALVLPILLVLVAGVVDFGHFLILAEGVVSAVGEGTRAGALAEEGEDPVAIAVAVAETAWAATALPGDLDVDAVASGTAPDRRLTVTGTLLPANLRYDHTLRLARQDDD
jgi:hypothetical protein